MVAVLPASPVVGVAFKWRCYEESLGRALRGKEGQHLLCSLLHMLYETLWLELQNHHGPELKTHPLVVEEL